MKCGACRKQIEPGFPFFKRTYYPACSVECADHIDNHIDDAIHAAKLKIKDWGPYALGESVYTKMGYY